MKILTNKVSPAGLQVKKRIDITSDEIDTAGIICVEAVDVDLNITKKEDQINISGKYKVFFKAECSRCCVEFDYQLDKQVKFEYKVDSKTEIDLKQIILEDILLSLPIKLLCRRDCKGLCGICGQNLNIDSCRHQQE